MNEQIKSVCVFCGSAQGLDRLYYDEAFKLGVLLAEKNMRLIFGAGKTGLMGAVADGILSCGGSAVGIIPKDVFQPQEIHDHLTKLEVVPNIQLRKARMYEYADAFIALPGGFGTLDELFETLTWAQIGFHNKPIGLLNTKNYYDPLITLIDHLHREKFIYDEHKVLLFKENDPEQLLTHLFNGHNSEEFKQLLSKD